MYSLTDSRLPHGEPESNARHHDFGLNVDFDHIKRKHKMLGIKEHVKYKWLQIFRYNTI